MKTVHFDKTSEIVSFIGTWRVSTLLCSSNLSNKVLDIDFGPEAAKISEVKVEG